MFSLKQKAYCLILLYIGAFTTKNNKIIGTSHISVKSHAIKRKWCWTKYCAKEREESYLSSVSSNWSEISPGLELQLWIYLKTVLYACAIKVKDQPIGLLRSDHNVASKNQQVKMPKVVAYPRCSAGRMHFTGTII